MTRGRQTEFDENVAAAICEEIAGGKSLIKALIEPGMPRASTVFKWLADERNRQFADNYARAVETRAARIFEEALEIADAVRIGERRKTTGDTVEVTTGDMVDRARLQVDTRKWFLAKMHPRKYGDRLEVAGDKDAPLGVKFVIEGLAPKLLEKKDE